MVSDKGILSLELFTIMFDILSRMLSRDESIGLFKGIKVRRNSPLVSYLVFADNLTIYSHASEEYVANIIHFLNRFCEWSGQKVNRDKSAVHFSKNSNDLLKGTVCTVLGMHEC